MPQIRPNLSLTWKRFPDNSVGSQIQVSSGYLVPLFSVWMTLDMLELMISISVFVSRGKEEENWHLVKEIVSQNF